MRIKVNMNSEVKMKNQPVGTVFAVQANKMAIKLGGDKCMYLGSGELFDLTEGCMAKKIKRLEGQV